MHWRELALIGHFGAFLRPCPNTASSNLKKFTIFISSSSVTTKLSYNFILYTALGCLTAVFACLGAGEKGFPRIQLK